MAWYSVKHTTKLLYLFVNSTWFGFVLTMCEIKMINWAKHIA